MKSLLKIYQENTCTFDGSAFSDQAGNEWSAPYLYRIAKERGIKPETVSLRHLMIDMMPWENGGISSIDRLIYHLVRIENADTSIPVIMGWDGYVMDGWHRIAKAIMEGKKSIKAYRFEKYVEPETKSV